MSQAQKIISNTVFNGMGYVWGLTVSLLLTPYIFNRIGAEQFGILVLVEVIINYSSLLDFSGIGGGFVKFIAGYNAKKEYNKLNEIINLGVTYYTTFWVIICFFIYFFQEPLLRFFNISESLQDKASFALYGVLCIAVISGGLSVFRSVLLGLQRMDITNKIQMAGTIPRILGTILVLSLGFELPGLIINSIFVTLFIMVAQIFCAYKILPSIRFRPFRFSISIFKECFHFGINVQAARFAELINTQVDKILLAHFINVSVVSFYELGYKIANVAKALPTQLLPAILPASSELNALQEKEKLLALYYRGTKYLSLLVFPITCFITYNASTILLLWMGNRTFEKSVLTVQILTIGYCFVLLISMARMVARGMGAPQYEMRSSLLTAILNIFLSIILILNFGFIGAMLGSSLAAVTGSLYFAFLFHRHIKEPIQRIVTTVCVPPLLSSLLAALIFPAVDSLFTWFALTPDGRIGAFGALIGLGVSYMGIYILLLFRKGFITKEDKELFSRTINFVKYLIPGYKQ